MEAGRLNNPIQQEENKLHQFNELREKYDLFLYKDFTVTRMEEGYQIKFFFEIPGLKEFTPTWTFPAKEEVNEEILRRLCFHLGIAESISYWKCTCSKVLRIQCGVLNEEQIAWWKKLFFQGLGEFMYLNQISIEENELVQIQCEIGNPTPFKDDKSYLGCLVPVGGGKDSVVSLELLKEEEITTFSINGNSTTEHVIEQCENKKGDYRAKRVLDKGLLELNEKGYLNGHTPFSSIVAFSSSISAFLNGNKYVVLSNETSANETTVKDSFVNHQYSKSFEFEEDFTWYFKTLTDSDIHYFSLLRPLTEMQIAAVFATCEKYHSVFRSCNAGSKKGIWCCNCPKCLFVYIILTPFLSQEKLISIFGENLLEKESLDLNFRELTGIEENKPFECVGTRREVLVALKYFVIKGGKSLLTDRYYEYIMKEQENVQDLLKSWECENNVPEEFQKLLKDSLNKICR